ncbi:amino acid ABC transporter permease [Kosmotoga pacifica]|uniref:amino acid ABC transporter permease n=1 Tax=Kosmotoga pacifica TaxID=1330330 RepID=UPI000AF94735|nr:amino acid ABC transporter permease [Kosmotoga pacifica]
MLMLERILKIVERYWPVLLKGLGVTMEMTLISVLGGFVLGLLLALSRVYGNKFLRIISTGFIEIIRGTPLLVQLFILYFGLPPYGVSPSPFTAAIIGFIINSGAYQAEYLRGSILSINRNQMVAARSLGMTRKQAIIHIIMPQALRRVIPAWTNEFIYLLKYTSLAYIVGAPELMAQAKFIASRNFQFFEVYLVVAVIYLAVILVFTWLFGLLEKKVKIPGLEWVR